MVNSKKINELVKNPYAVTTTDLKDLSEAINEFPYFQALHAIHLKALKQNESFSYNQKLKETAAHTLDRDVLFQFITNFNRSEASYKNVAENNSGLEQKEKSAIPEIKNLNSEVKEQNTVAKIISAPAEEVSIEPNTPLEFSVEERHSFSEWLKLTSAIPIERQEEVAKKTPTSKKKKLIESPLIDKFLKTNPKIKPAKKANPTVNLAVTASTETDSLMTETLAKVYIAQKNYKKAIQAYKILSLKNPEKSGLFADQIRAIKKLQENNL